MNIEEINRIGYEFVTKLKCLEKNENKHERKGSLKHLPIILDLSDRIVDSPIIVRTLDHNLSDFQIAIESKGEKFGFANDEYKNFYSFVINISLASNYSTIVSKEFIEEQILKWILDVHLNKKSNIDLYQHLQEVVNNAIEESIYYFPVLNLHIPKSFKIGEVELTFFTKEYFDGLWNRRKEIVEYSKKEFDNIYRKYQGTVYASVKVKAESKKAKEIGFEKCSTAIDILKMFTPTIMFPSRKCYVDLEERININYKSNFLIRSTELPDELDISMSAKNDPFILDDIGLKNLQNAGLEIFSKFLLSNNIDLELYRLIKQSIVLFSRAISTFDLHFRVAQLITILESLLLEDDRKYKLEKYCKNRCCELLFSSNIDDKEKCNMNLSNMYQIRHKIIHKAIRLNINLTELKDFQILLIELFKSLIHLNNQINTKSELLILIDNRKKGSAQHAI